MEEKDKGSEIPQKSHELACFMRGFHDVVAAKIQGDEPVIVAISGLSALGKSMIANRLAASFDDATILQTDGFQLEREERRRRNIIHGDDPAVFNFDGLNRAIQELTAGNPIEVPTYNHQNGKLDSTVVLQPSEILIIEGTSSLYDETKLPSPAIKIFLDANDETGIYLRHKVNTEQRGHSEEQFQQELAKYLEAYEHFIRPSKINADYLCMVNKNWQYNAEFILQCICAGPVISAPSA